MQIKDWIDAARLRTLPLSLSGIIVGSFVAKWRMDKNGDFWDWKIFACALIVTLLYQVLSNYANDYGDGKKGTDANRLQEAEQRAIASGKISLSQMKKGIIITSILAFVATIVLLYFSFLQYNLINEFYTFIGLGGCCILAAIGYTMGEKPYGYFGLGDIMVFIFFGLVSVAGSYFLFTKTFHWDILVPASAIGLMSTAVLNLNNMRDIEGDSKSGKKTLAIRMGFRNAMVYEMILLQLPIILFLVFLMMNKLQETGNYYAFIVMILIFPLAALRRRIMQTKTPKELDPFLKQVGIITFIMSVLLAFGLNYFK